MNRFIFGIISISVCFCIILFMQKSVGREVYERSREDKRTEAKDNIRIAEDLKLTEEIDMEQPNAKADVLTEAGELSHLAVLYKEFNEARLEKNAVKIKEKMEAFFRGIDHWLEKAKEAKRKEHKDALKRAFANARKSFADGLQAEGVTDFVIQAKDSNEKKFLKALLRYEDAKTLMLDAVNDEQREAAYQLARQIKNEFQGYLRDAQHDEL